MSVYIENQSGIHFPFHYRVLIGECVRTVMEDKEIPSDLDINVLITDPDRMQEINREHRGIDQVTDVLSFPYFEFDQPGCFDQEQQDWAEEDILGDIVLCADRILSQAEEYGHSPKREMAFLIVHSMLHLIGYDHMEDGEREEMEAEQKRLMENLGIRR